KRRTRRGHDSAGGCCDGSAVRREDVDAGVEVEGAVVSRLQLERGRAEFLDDRGPHDRAHQLTWPDRVRKYARRKIRTHRRVDWDHEHRSRRERVTDAIE